MYGRYKGTRFEVWILLKEDPFELARGFSIKGRELRCMEYEPVHDVMQDMQGHTQPGTFWVVKAEEVYRVIPEMKRFPIQMKPWFFPFEFCQTFIRPKNYLQGKVVEHNLPPK